MPGPVFVFNQASGPVIFYVMPDDEVTIRDSVEDDIPRITEIYARSVTQEVASFELTPPDQAEMARRRQGILDKGMPYLVAEQAGMIVGYAYAGPFHARPAYGATLENSVYVDPRAQRRGVGSLLTRRIIGICTAKGYRQMIAVISGLEDSASIKMHRALGFKNVGTNISVGYKLGRWIDIFYLQLALGEGDKTPPEQDLVS